MCTALPGKPQSLPLKHRNIDELAVLARDGAELKHCLKVNTGSFKVTVQKHDALKYKGHDENTVCVLMIIMVICRQCKKKQSLVCFSLG